MGSRLRFLCLPCSFIIVLLMLVLWLVVVFFQMIYDSTLFIIKGKTFFRSPLSLSLSGSPPLSLQPSLSSSGSPSAFRPPSPLLQTHISYPLHPFHPFPGFSPFPSTHLHYHPFTSISQVYPPSLSLSLSPPSCVCVCKLGRIII